MTFIHFYSDSMVPCEEEEGLDGETDGEDSSDASVR